MDSFKDYYAVLGVLPSAEAAVISAAYRALANLYHPDKHQDATAKKKAEARMKELNEAYATLSNEQTRGEYDERRNAAGYTNSKHDSDCNFDDVTGSSAEQAQARDQSSKSDSTTVMKPLRAELGGVVLATIGSFAGIVVTSALISQERESFNWGLLALPCIVLIAGLAKIGRRQRIHSDQKEGPSVNPINQYAHTAGAWGDRRNIRESLVSGGWKPRT